MKNISRIILISLCTILIFFGLYMLKLHELDKYNTGTGLTQKEKIDNLQHELGATKDFQKAKELSKSYGLYFDDMDDIIKIYQESGNSYMYLDKAVNIVKNNKSIKKQVSVVNTEKVNPTIGMSKEEALNSLWGKPKDINKTTTKDGTDEQWVYDNNRYLYFDNGILTTIQE